MSIALIDIIAMLATNTFMMYKATETPDYVSPTELISMQGGFSIYSGWVTAATILNAAYVLKRIGVADPNIPYFDEEQISVFVLYVAFIIYNWVAYNDRNPVYGGVFLWVLVAIEMNLMNNEPQYQTLANHADILRIAHTLSMTYLSFKVLGLLGDD